ncbi:hypothetical protein RCO48_28255 [Peribacillus frigoritolerans]|nr:hypothetical protein [Peribacillus frigoritolerans]
MANIQEEIKKLQDIHNILMTRLYNIEHFTNSYKNSDIVIKQFEEREYIQLAKWVSWTDTEKSLFWIFGAQKQDWWNHSCFGQQ